MSLSGFGEPFPIRGVYPGMFEQSILIDREHGKRTGALAVSITMQALAVSFLLLVPLLFNDRLPDVRPWTVLSLPPIPLPPPPEPVVHESIATTTTTSLAPRPMFHLFPTPTRVPSGPIVIDTTMPVLNDAIGIGVPGPAFGPAPMPTQIAVAPAPAVVTPPQIDKPRAVGGDVQAAKILKKVLPIYPPLAISARISGTVHLVGIIAKDGTVQKLEIVSGHPFLVRAAVDAVRQWVYKPTLLNGEAIEVIAPIDVIFNLR